jgi:hypothetical protein
MANKKLGNGDSEEELSTKQQKIAALNAFWGDKLPWDKWTEAEIDKFLIIVTQPDEMCLKFFSASDNKIQLAREVGMRRLESGFSDRMNQLRTIANFADGLRPMNRLADMAKMADDQNK